jgi:hypothetical protein
MSFLESIQHGLEKASQQAARITKIQHLHKIADDLNFKASQQGQNLLAKAMEMYHNGILAQGELTSICKQIADYQQQLHEVQEEIQRLQSDEDEQPEIPAPPAAAPGYAPYPQAVPAPAGYAPPYPPQAGYPAAPASRSPTQPLAHSSAPPPVPDAPAPESAPPASHHKATHHRAPHPDSDPVPAAASDQQAASLPGTYANGALPPIYSPFAQAPATDTPAEPERSEKAHHSTKKAASDAQEK